MNRKEFLKILQDPTQLQNDQVFELEDIIKSFPYFQAARVLHLKGLKIQDSFRYNQSLKTTAIHTTDRSVLFHFITSDVFHESQSNKQEQEIIEEIELVDNNVLENIEKEDLTENDIPDILEILGIERTEDQTDDLDEKSFEELESDLIPTDPTLDATNRITDDFLITEDEIEEIDDSFEETTIDSFEEDDFDELTDIEEKVIEPSEDVLKHSEEEIDTFKEDDFDELTDNIEEKVIEPSENVIKHSEEEIDTFKEDDFDELTDIEEKVIEPNEDVEKEKSFSFEIDIKDKIETLETNTQKEVSIKNTIDYSINFEPANEDDIDLEENEAKHKEVESISFNLDVEKPIQFKKDDTHSFSEWMQLTSFKPIDRSTTSIKSGEQINKMDLIDEFIENNPKIKPVKTANFSVNFNQIEEVESEAVMTETLARIYTEQHKYGNAIKAYEVLSLKFPEKSGFFADQIKKLKELKKTN